MLLANPRLRLVSAMLLKGGTIAPSSWTGDVVSHPVQRPGWPRRELGRVGRPKGAEGPDLPHAVWRKSTRSGANGCVEVAFLNSRVAVRDSKDAPSGDGEMPILVFSADAWTGFIGGVRNGEFDLPSHFSEFSSQ